MRGSTLSVIEELGALAASRPDDSPAWREIAYLSRHAAAGRLWYDCFRCRGVPLGSGAIENTVRRLINLRLKGTSTFWEEANAEVVIQLRAAVLSGRWDQVLDRTRAATARPTDGLALGAAGLPGGVEGARRPGRGIAATINEETL